VDQLPPLPLTQCTVAISAPAHLYRDPRAIISQPARMSLNNDRKGRAGSCDGEEVIARGKPVRCG
jgi:hypothetical protein